MRLRSFLKVAFLAATVVRSADLLKFTAERASDSPAKVAREIVAVAHVEREQAVASTSAGFLKMCEVILGECFRRGSKQSPPKPHVTGMKPPFF